MNKIKTTENPVGMRLFVSFFLLCFFPFYVLSQIYVAQSTTFFISENTVVSTKIPKKSEAIIYVTAPITIVNIQEFSSATITYLHNIDESKKRVSSKRKSKKKAKKRTKDNAISKPSVETKVEFANDNGHNSTNLIRAQFNLAIVSPSNHQKKSIFSISEIYFGTFLFDTTHNGLHVFHKGLIPQVDKDFFSIRPPPFCYTHKS